MKYNELTLKVGDKLYHWFRSGKKINGKFTPYLSFSTGFRVTEYNRDGADPDAKVFALKAFPMNVFITEDIMQHVVDCVQAARDEVMAEENA